MEIKETVISKCLDKTSKNLKSSGIKHRIIKTKEGFDELEADWNLLSEKIKPHIFQTFDWNRTWWDHFGSHGELQIFVLYQGETAVGIAPLFRDRYTAWGIKPYVFLRMIGSRVSKTDEGVLLGEIAYSDYLQFLIHDDFITPFYKHLQFFLQYEVDFDELILEEVPEKSTTLIIFDDDFTFSSYELNIENASRSHQVLPENKWKNYLMKLTVKERSNVRRALKTVKKGDKQLFRIEKRNCESTFKPSLKRFIELHQQQWNERGFPGTFAETSMNKFFIEISEKLHAKGYLLIYALFPKGEQNIEHCLAIDIVVAYNQNLYGQHMALNMSSPHFKKAPGKALLLATVMESVKSEMTYDFLRGSESYKQRLATHVQQNKLIRFFDSSGRKWMHKGIITSIQQIRKTVTVERTRMQVVMSQNKSDPAIIRYVNFLYTRISKQF